MDKYNLDGDEAVRSTNDDASHCKRFAVQLGYWTDPYLPLLVRNAERKTPEINRGYFARVIGITNMIEKFVKVTLTTNTTNSHSLYYYNNIPFWMKAMKGNCQIVNFGAGFDTLYWRLLDAGLPLKKFVEIDFSNVTSRKCHYIRNNEKLIHSLQSDGIYYVIYFINYGKNLIPVLQMKR